MRATAELRYLKTVVGKSEIKRTLQQKSRNWWGRTVWKDVTNIPEVDTAYAGTLQSLLKKDDYRVVPVDKGVIPLSKEITERGHSVHYSGFPPASLIKTATLKRA